MSAMCVANAIFRSGFFSASESVVYLAAPIGDDIPEIFTPHTSECGASYEPTLAFDESDLERRLSNVEIAESRNNAQSADSMYNEQ